MTNYTERYRSEDLKEISLTDNIKSYKITIIFIFSFLALAIILSAFIKYPEKITGKAFIVSNNKINNIYSPNNGEIILKIQENIFVKKGDLLALIDNPTNYNDLYKLKASLSKIDVNNIPKSMKDFKFEKSLKLGEIEKYYYNFLLALIEYDNTIKIDLTSKKILNLRDKIKQNMEKLKIGLSVKELFYKKHEISSNSFTQDSILFLENAIVRDEISKSRFNMLNSKERKLVINKNKMELEHYNQDLLNEIQLLQKEKKKNEASTLFNVQKAFLELRTAIDFWEYNYTVIAPVSGKLEFYQPSFSSTQYVKKDMPLFIIMPKADSLYARGIMPGNGYGQIRTLDTVFLKMKDYPYREYGEIKGLIYNKSKVYHDSIYYIDIRLLDGLKTNHGKFIDFTYNMSGEIEYYTKKSTLLQRIFNNINSSVNK